MTATLDKVTIDYRLCKKCRICAELCPKNVFSLQMDGTPEVVRGEACSECGLCILICPDYAIDWVPGRREDPAK